MKLPLDTARRSKPPSRTNRRIPGVAVDLRSPGSPHSHTSSQCSNEHNGSRKGLLSPTSIKQLHSPDSLSPVSITSLTDITHLSR